MESVRPLKTRRFTWRVLIIVAGIVALIGFFTFRRITDPVDDPLFRGQRVTEWARQLNGPNRAEREEAAATLQEMGAAAVPALERALQTRDASFKDLVLRIAQSAPDKMGAFLFRIFKPNEPGRLRLAAAKALKELGPTAKDAVPSLAGALRDTEITVAWEAAGALARIGPETVPHLLELLQTSQHPMRRSSACYALSLLGRESPPEDQARIIATLIHSLEDPVRIVSEQAQQAFSKIGKPAVPALRANLQHPNPRVVADTIRSLGGIGPLAYEALADVKKFAKSEELIIRRAATEAMGTIRPSDPEVARLLAEALQDPNDAVRLGAIRLMGRAPDTAKPHIIPALIQALRDHLPEVRRLAAFHLSRTGESSPEIVTALEPLTRDADPAVNQSAREALRALNPDQANAAETRAPLHRQ